MKKSFSALLVLSLPLSFNAMAKPTVIPKAEQYLKEAKAHKLKNAKGTLIGAGAEAETTPANWFNLAPAQGAEGVGTELAYELFGDKGAEIVVAVIDSGVDVNHEDLQGKMWKNKGEIANDGIDNDGNGYIDDVFGWSFLGAKDGNAQIVADPTNANGMRLIQLHPEKQVDADTLEVTRELVRLEKLQASGVKLSKAEEKLLAQVKAEVEGAYNQAKLVVKKYGDLKKQYNESAPVLRGAGVESITAVAVANFTPGNEDEEKAKAALTAFFKAVASIERVEAILGYYGDQIKFYYNKDFNPRLIVGDNYADVTEKAYGNNNVIGPDSSHGTHVSGIIAANRNNNLGIKGVATNVKIMAIRCVPNGDERDKDVANSIRYAVDNGAKIINMSFGKSYSPYKKAAVDEAVKYAAKKGVLLVHAAGNSNQDNNTAANFPNRRLGKNILGKTIEANNWLEIGASSFKKGVDLPAEFSNYGSKSVDLFAPGVDILSSTPDNTYDTYSGTSMASPTAAGVAALLLSQDATMKAKDLKQLIVETSRKHKDLEVKLPGDEKLVKFGTLSIHGSIADVLEASKAIH